MSNPHFFTSEDVPNDLASWGTAAHALYLAAPANGPGITLNRVDIELAPDSSSSWPTALPLLNLGIKAVPETLDTTSLTGGGVIYPMHSGTPSAVTELWSGPAISHFGGYLELWETCGATTPARRSLDFTNAGRFRAEAGHYLAVQIYPGVNGVSDGAGDLWLFDAFRITFYVAE